MGASGDIDVSIGQFGGLSDNSSNFAHSMQTASCTAGNPPRADIARGAPSTGAKDSSSRGTLSASIAYIYRTNPIGIGGRQTLRSNSRRQNSQLACIESARRCSWTMVARTLLQSMRTLLQSMRWLERSAQYSVAYAGAAKPASECEQNCTTPLTAA